MEKMRIVMKNKDVAIIILNWNNYEDTYECLKSLENLIYSNFDVYLVDNNSDDNSFTKLINDQDNGKFTVHINFIKSTANIGFAGGNNLGINQAYNEKYKYFWLLNNDTIVDKYSLGELVETLEN